MEHQAFHRLFGNMLPNEVAAMLTDTWIDSEYYLVAIPRKRKKARKKRKTMYCIDCHSEILREIPPTKKA
jgi:DNA-binding GntR family transcriptional regulator